MSVGNNIVISRPIRVHPNYLRLDFKVRFPDTGLAYKSHPTSHSANPFERCGYSTVLANQRSSQSPTIRREGCGHSATDFRHRGGNATDSRQLVGQATHYSLFFLYLTRLTFKRSNSSTSSRIPSSKSPSGTWATIVAAITPLPKSLVSKHK